MKQSILVTLACVEITWQPWSTILLIYRRQYGLVDVRSFYMQWWSGPRIAARDWTTSTVQSVVYPIIRTVQPQVEIVEIVLVLSFNTLYRDWWVVALYILTRRGRNDSNVSLRLTRASGKGQEGVESLISSLPVCWGWIHREWGNWMKYFKSRQLVMVYFG